MFNSIYKYSKHLILFGVLTLFGLTTTSNGQVRLELPTITDGIVGERDTIDVLIQDITSENVIGFNFSISYDPSVLEIVGHLSPIGTLTSNATTSASKLTDRYNVAGAQANPITGSGTFLKLIIEYNGEGTSTLLWQKSELNKLDDTNLTVNAINGSVTIPSKTLEFSFVNDNVALGDSFTIPILLNEIADSDSVWGITFDLGFDHNVISLDSLVEANGSDTFFNLINDSTARVSIAKSSNIIVNGTLVNIYARALAIGISNVEIKNVSVEKYDDTILTATVSNGEITVSDLYVQVQNTTGVKGDTILVPVTTTSPGQTVLSFEMGLNYDSSKLKILGVSTEGTISSVSNGWTVTPNSVSATTFIAGASGTGFNEEGVLLNLVVALLDEGNHDIGIDSFIYDEDSSIIVGKLSGSITTEYQQIPVFTEIFSDTVVTEFTQFEFTFTADDANSTDIISYELVNGPSGSLFDISTGLFTWDIGYGAGDSTYSLSIIASDGKSMVSSDVNISIRKSDANVQVVHNAADPIASSVDIYINNIQALSEFKFREATPFLTLPSEVSLDISVYPAGANPEMENAVYEFNDALLESDSTYTLVANGNLQDGFSANPNGINTDFGIYVLNSKLTLDSETDVSAYVWHGATDVPSVDVYARGVGKIIDSLSYGNSSGELYVPATSYIFDITAAGSEDVLLSYTADLSAAAGQVVGVYASGYLNPEANNNGSAFGLLAVFADGTTALLATAEPPAYDVTFTVYTDLASFNPENDDIYIAGGFAGWQQPGSNSNYKMSLVEGKTNIYSITLPIQNGEYPYKYFVVAKGTSDWNRGEWPGDPNRSITVDGSTSVTELFGLKPNENLSIETARTLQTGAPVQVRGIVTTPDFGFNNAEFYIQDANGGTKVRWSGFGGGNTDTPFEEGQNLTINGNMGARFDEVQIEPSEYVINSENNSLPEAIIFPGADEWVVGSEYQGMRITLTNMILPEASGWPVEKINSSSGVTTTLEGTLEQYLGVTYDVRIDRDESYFDGSPRPTGNFNLSGVMGRFRDAVQIFPFFEDELGIATSNETIDGLPSEFELNQNYPNPFNPTTQIKFALPSASDVKIEVYNVVGQRVSTLVDTRFNAGYHTVQFDATGLNSGMYLYRIVASEFTQVKSMILIK